MHSQNKIAKGKIRKIYYMGSVTALLMVTLAVTYIFMTDFTAHHKKKINQLAESITNEKKRFLKNAVDRTIYLIKSERELIKKEKQNLGLTQEQIEEIVINRVSTLIRNQRLIDDGYLWVNQIVHYDGGDKYAIRKIHPNLPETEGSWLSTNTTDIKGNQPYKVELDGVKQNGEIYFDYYFKQLKSEKISHKLSYAKLYKPYDWVIATGVYLDEVDELIERETRSMIKSHNQSLFIALILVAIVALFSLLILMLFEKQIRKALDLYEQQIKRSNDNLFKEHEKTVKALAEVRQLKGMLPICSSCKKIRDDEGYWNQIESYIRKHSDVSFTHGYCPECYEMELKKIDQWNNKE